MSLGRVDRGLPDHVDRHTQLLGHMHERSAYIRSVVDETLDYNVDAIYRAVLVVEEWLRDNAEIRIVGYGRARLALGIPGNRLAHAGGKVSVLGDVAPLASTSRGGGLIAASSSGLTSHVLEILARCKRQGPRVAIIGAAVQDATRFSSFCDVFIGISAPVVTLRPSLLNFSDAVEYAISEVMDAVVAAAVRRAGITERDLRLGHEDLGGTGPYTAHAEDCQ